MTTGISSGSDGGSGISQRKAKHLEISVEEENYRIEGTGGGFERVRFVHHALPEMAADEVDPSLDFLGQRVSLPLFISCMTGGFEEGRALNRVLAQAAQKARIPVGMGSIRLLFHDPGAFDQFHMKPWAPDVPVIANLGAVQVRDLPPERIVAMLERLEVQALAVHLNAGQELFQPGGDRDFSGLRQAVARLCDRSPIPVIVKETGFGFRPSEVDDLLEAGAAYVDLAGAGGTNWVLVESYRADAETAEVAREFEDWGIPTALLLVSLAGKERRILASGGIRSGMEVAKSIALGASLAGMALPFIRAVHREGVEGALRLISRIRRSLQAVMVLTGCRSLAELRQAGLIIEPSLAAEAQSLAQGDKGK